MAPQTPLDASAARPRGQAGQGMVRRSFALWHELNAKSPGRQAASATAECFDEAAGLRFGFLNCLATELDHEPSAAFGEQGESFGVDALGARVVDEEVVETFEADGLVRHDLGDVVGALVNVGVGDD